MKLRLVALALATLFSVPAAATVPTAAEDTGPIKPPPAPGAPTGLADLTALRATRVRHAASGYRTAAGESAAHRNGSDPALGAARTPDLLVRPPAACVVFGAEKAGAAGDRHCRHRQRRQHGEAVDAACRALRSRLSRVDDALTDLPGLHRVRIEHRGRGRPASGRSGSVRSDAADRRAFAAQG